MQEEIIPACRTAKIGCFDCKLKLIDSMLRGMRPIMERRREFAAKPREVQEILAEGSQRAQKVARATLEEAKAAMEL